MGAPGYDVTAARTMPLREKIAQLICVRIGSNTQPVRTVAQDEERVSWLLDACCLGGLVLFNGGAQARPVLDRLQARAQLPLLVGADIERGVGQQMQEGTLFPHAMAFSKLPSSEGNAAVEEFARTLVSEAYDGGIHITFGPVADVSTNPDNPIIATRAFSDDPQRAAELVSRFVRQVQSAGLWATAKHFPGHGDTDLDSHATLPIVTKTREQLEKCEFVPFRAAIDAGCALIMSAHVGFPSLDATGAPATFSSAILQKLLRDEMGFRGVICTDSLLMAGARDHFESEGDMAQAALNAGVDLLLDVIDPLAVIEHLCRCVEQGTLDISRIDESLQRVSKLRAPRPTVAHKPASQSSALSVARKAIRLVSELDHALLPLDAAKPLAAIFLKPFETPLDRPEQPLAAALRRHFHDVKYLQLGPHSNAAAYEAAHDIARSSSQLLVAMVVRPAAWQIFGLREEQKAFVYDRLRECRDIILVSLGVPTILDDFPQAATRICSYSDVPVSQEAVVEFLLRFKPPMT